MQKRREKVVQVPEEKTERGGIKKEERRDESTKSENRKVL